MTATDGNSGDDAPARGSIVRGPGAVVGQVDGTCRTAVHGRRAARVLAEWAKPFCLTEAEFQLLWRLRSAPTSGLDQTALAHALAFSPAQISACVERLRERTWVCARTAPGDRRRRHWQLSQTGRQLLDQMLTVGAILRIETNDENEPNANGSPGREAAA